MPTNRATMQKNSSDEHENRSYSYGRRMPIRIDQEGANSVSKKEKRAILEETLEDDTSETTQDNLGMIALSEIATKLGQSDHTYMEKPQCPRCLSNTVTKNGVSEKRGSVPLQHWKCKECAYTFRTEVGSVSAVNPKPPNYLSYEQIRAQRSKQPSMMCTPSVSPLPQPPTPPEIPLLTIAPETAAFQDAIGVFNTQTKTTGNPKMQNIQSLLEPKEVILEHFRKEIKEEKEAFLNEVRETILDKQSFCEHKVQQLLPAQMQMLRDYIDRYIEAKLAPYHLDQQTNMPLYRHPYPGYVPNPYPMGYSAGQTHLPPPNCQKERECMHPSRKNNRKHPHSRTSQLNQRMEDQPDIDSQNEFNMCLKGTFSYPSIRPNRSKTCKAPPAAPKLKWINTTITSEHYKHSSSHGSSNAQSANNSTHNKNTTMSGHREGMIKHPNTTSATSAHTNPGGTKATGRPNPKQAPKSVSDSKDSTNRNPANSQGTKDISTSSTQNTLDSSGIGSKQ
ncbi:hypothetical protein NEOKW01_1311 [Nematocida sp. AWRm80]|nr:hypothetical protein NEOKW01_1311 [Nematocida sp. AWRm80]